MSEYEIFSTILLIFIFYIGYAINKSIGFDLLPLMIFKEPYSL